MRNASEQMLHAAAVWYVDHMTVVLIAIFLAVLVINGWNFWVVRCLLRRYRPRVCKNCGVYYACPPSQLCSGCQAYEEHQW